MYGRVSFKGLSLCSDPRRKVLYVLPAIWKVWSRWGWKPVHDAVYRWIRKRAMRWALEECCVRNRWVNRPSSRWRHLTKTIRIHFVFHFLISLVSPPAKLNKPNTIYPRKKKQTEGFNYEVKLPNVKFYMEDKHKTMLLMTVVMVVVVSLKPDRRSGMVFHGSGRFKLLQFTFDSSLCCEEIDGSFLSKNWNKIPKFRWWCVIASNHDVHDVQISKLFIKLQNILILKAFYSKQAKPNVKWNSS